MGMYREGTENVGFRRGGRSSVGFDTGRKSRAKQQFRDECDINVLMKKYEKGIAITHLNRYEGKYEDVSQAVDYHEAHNIVIKAQEAFGSLPSSVRAQFENDPGRFMDFALDERNRDELVKMGLARPIEDLAPPAREEPSPAPGKGKEGGDAK